MPPENKPIPLPASDRRSKRDSSRANGQTLSRCHGWNLQFAQQQICRLKVVTQHLVAVISSSNPALDLQDRRRQKKLFRSWSEEELNSIVRHDCLQSHPQFGQKLRIEGIHYIRAVQAEDRYRPPSISNSMVSYIQRSHPISGDEVLRLRAINPEAVVHSWL